MMGGMCPTCVGQVPKIHRNCLCLGVQSLGQKRVAWLAAASCGSVKYPRFMSISRCSWPVQQFRLIPDEELQAIRPESGSVVL